MQESEKNFLSPDELLLSSSPHIQTANSVSRTMTIVLVALLPIVLSAMVIFGWRAFLVVAATTFFCCFAEGLWCKLADKSVIGTLKDGSAAVTGVLLGLNFSVGVPLWVTLIGAFLAIWLGKQVYGGLGQNPFNPALVARVGLLIALPGIMTTWQPTRSMIQPEEASYTSLFMDGSAIAGNHDEIDALTCATPLGVAKLTPKQPGRGVIANSTFEKLDNPSVWSNCFFGNRPGCLGEVSSFAVLLGGLILLLGGVLKWRIPLAFVGTVAFFTAIVHSVAPGMTPGAIFHILNGGLLFGAFFMATDMVTSPVSRLGGVIFGCGCGIITCVIRIWGNYPEGVSFSILFMNALVPLIDRLTTSRPFGYVRNRG